jgi:hypothetical protein
MADAKKITAKLSLRKITSIIIMCASLLFLTGINFFLFPQNNKNIISAFSGNGKEIPQGPVEEKSTENKSLASVQEEYFHEHTLKEFVWCNDLFLHKIHKAEKLQIVYYEIVSPPPKA